MEINKEALAATTTPMLATMLPFHPHMPEEQPPWAKKPRFAPSSLTSRLHPLPASLPLAAALSNSLGTSSRQHHPATLALNRSASAASAGGSSSASSSCSVSSGWSFSDEDSVCSSTASSRSTTPVPPAASSPCTGATAIAASVIRPLHVGRHQQQRLAGMKRPLRTASSPQFHHQPRRLMAAAAATGGMSILSRSASMTGVAVSAGRSAQAQQERIRRTLMQNKQQPKKAPPKPDPVRFLETKIFSQSDAGRQTLQSASVQQQPSRPSQAALDAYNLQVVQAVRDGDTCKLRSMLGQQSMDCCNRFGESLLHLASRRGNLAVVKFLVEEAHVPVDRRDDFGRTPLHDACWTARPNTDILEVLLRHAPSPAVLLSLDVRGFTPFHYARKDHWETWMNFLQDMAPELRTRVDAMQVVG